MKQEEKSRISRETIIIAAIEEFSTAAYEKASLNQICQKHHISKGKIYHHFENKDALYIACLSYAADKAVAYNILNTDSGEQLDEKFHNLFLIRQQFMLDYPYIASFLYLTFKSPPDFLQEILKDYRKRFKDATTQMLVTTFSPYPWFKEEQLPYFTEMFVLASDRVHEAGLDDWHPDDPLEKRKLLVKKNVALFDELFHIFLYGILPR